MSSDWNQIAFADRCSGVEVVPSSGVGKWKSRVYRESEEGGGEGEGVGEGEKGKEEVGKEELSLISTAEERRMKAKDVRGRVMAIEEKVKERKGRKRVRTVAELQEDMKEMIELGEKVRHLVDVTIQKRARLLENLQQRRRRASLEAQAKRMAKIDNTEFPNDVGSPF